MVESKHQSSRSSRIDELPGILVRIGSHNDALDISVLTRYLCVSPLNAGMHLTTPSHLKLHISLSSLASVMSTRGFWECSLHSLIYSDPKKGFGFIVPDDGSPDCFAHYSAVHADGFKSLGDGEEVEFDIVEEEGGRRRAESISGPGGVPVQGSARRWSSYNDDNGQGGGNQGGDGGYDRF